MTDDTGYEVILYRKGTAGTITLSKVTADATIGGGVMKRAFQHDENNISSVALTLDNASLIPAENLLHSSCALWSNSVTGALQMGDYVRYSVYPTSTGNKTQVFYGKITEMRPTTDGTLQIVAVDYLKKFEREYNKTVFANYKDLVVKPHVNSNALRAITGITESDIAVPMVWVGFATTDARKTLTGTGTYLALLSDMVDLWEQAQAFQALGDGLIGVRYQYTSMDITTGGNITCAVQADVDGEPSGVDLASSVFSIPLDSTINVAVQVDFTDELSSQPVPLEKGRTYWIVWRCDAAIVGTSVGITYHDITASDPYTVRFYSRCLTPLTGWWYTYPYNFNLRLDFTNYDEVTPDRYMVDAANDRIILANNDTPITTVDSYYTLNRGKVSYYYNTITHQNICDALAALVGSITSTTSGNQTRTFNTYNTVGKKLIDCFKELADVWETSGSWSGYQHAFAHQEISGVQYIGWGKRLSLSDTPAAFTFNHGTDGTVDNEHRIIDYTGLVNRTDVRPAGILVIGGKDASGNPIVASVSDKSLTASFATQMENFTNLEKISDESIVTREDAFKRAYAALDSYRRNTWEGTIRVSGVYPDLFDITWGSGSFGSGKIVGLSISPVGIYQQFFKVRGIVVHENETEITLSNIWFDIENRPTKTFLKTDRSEAFIAEVGMAANLYFACHVDVAFTTTPVYMAFMDASFNQLCVRRILCEVYAAATYSGSGLGLRVYHAEFETENGFTVDGTPIAELGLFAADGTPLLYYDLVASLRNENFYKWKTQRLIVDFSTKS
jgi:hypothetical protein